MNPLLRRSSIQALAFAAIVALAAPHLGAQIVLGTSADFAVLGGSTVTNTGNTVISGAAGGLGLSPGTAVTGFPPGVLTTGTIHAADATAIAAKADATTAYNQLAGLPFRTDLTGQDLAGKILTPGVYRFDAAAALTNGVLTLDGLNQANPLFVFQVGSTLTTTGTTSFNLINGAASANAWFQVGSSATLGVGTSFGANVVAFTSITLTTGVNVIGRVFAINGAVTLDSNQITVPASAIPEPSTYAVIVAGLALLGAFVCRASAAKPPQA